ncbi:MAG: AtpZ/AtpI family protein [Phycisphaerales bacterium]|nr:AtpZ/AtpI family protein [Phycisphaerales bacterium]
MAPLWKLSAMGFTMACEILAGLLPGWLVDSWAGTDRIFLVIGTIMGVIVGMTGFIRTALKASRAAGRKASGMPRGGEEGDG